MARARFSQGGLPGKIVKKTSAAAKRHPQAPLSYRSAGANVNTTGLEERHTVGREPYRKGAFPERGRQ